MPDTIKRTTGTKVAFGDVVQLSKERSKDPEADGFERYIGLEHLESSDLKVRSWGDLADGVTFTNVFRPGQVLFGKRRAYQRKVAVADFSGVCSGDIYVLEPKGEQLLPELLPFICQSEPFYDYVISMSQGGLSPRVNWKALAKYEFALPPLEEQRRIAKGLKSATIALEKCQDLSARLAQLRNALGFSLWNPKWDKKNMTPLGDVCIKIQDGTHFSPQSTEGEFLYVTSKNIRDGYLDISTAGHISREEHEGIYKRCDVQFGDLLLTKDGANAGNIAVNTIKEEFSLLSSVAFIRPDPEKLDPTYAFEYLRSCVGQARLLAHVKGSAITRLTLTQIRGFPIPLPDIGTQKQNALELSEIQSRLDDLAGRQAALGSVITSMKQSLDMPV